MSPTGAEPEQAIWQILQLSDALDLEFASVLSEQVPVLLWEPARRLIPFDVGFSKSERLAPASGLRIRSFPRTRGFARLPFSVLSLTGAALTHRLERQAASPANSVLLCTTPFFAPVAERWRGPVIYWLTDLIARYGGAGFRKVRKLDERMCRVATLVCPNSEKIAEYLQTDAKCPATRCEVLPNATGARSLLPAPLFAPQPLPAPFTDLPRPLAGVIGNLAENTDWVFLEELLDRLPWLYWLLVGPCATRVNNRVQELARQRVLKHERTFFTGGQPYTELYRYARGVDVAILPYRLREPTFSGSSTRFYDHLAACHPILATTAVYALRDQEPLLRLVNDAREAASILESLRAAQFQDGMRETRWRASLDNTWGDRAAAMIRSLHARLPQGR